MKIIMSYLVTFSLIIRILEAEGNFRLISLTSVENLNLQVGYVGQNFEHFIIKAIRDYFGGDNKIQIITSKKEFSDKRKLLGEVQHYYVELGSKAVKSAIYAQFFSKYPLLGHKGDLFEMI